MQRKLTKMICMGMMLIMCVGFLYACNTGDYRNPINGAPQDGEVYTLQQAYDNGWLSRNQLKSIAYYDAPDKKCFGNYKPIALNPLVLPETIENKIKQTYLNSLKDIAPEAEISAIHITGYYGIYDDCVMVKIVDDYVCLDLFIKETHEIGGVTFYKYDGQIRVYAK